MQNVFDIKHEKNLNFILPTKHTIGSAVNKSKAVIVVHLHYPDTVNFYLEYLKAVPDDMTVLFTVSSGELGERLQKSDLFKKKKCTIIKKENRGRDISSFLVACREEILKYEYVCFLHDKKEKDQLYKKDTDEWIRSLWENMVCSSQYIENILVTFQENADLGLLAPPFPISDNFTTAYVNTWFINYEQTRKLAEKLNLVCDMDETKTPVTLGTVFWAKVPALKKLFDISWKYTDFDEEPLKSDGTLNHAIERILAFVAQDAGYDTGWAITDKYAGEHLEYMHMILKKSFGILQNLLNVLCVSELQSVEKLLNFIDKRAEFYIYGAGVRGKEIFQLLKKFEKFPKAFLVSNRSHNPENILEIPVYSLSQIELDDQCGIILGVGERYKDEVLKEIMCRYPQFKNIFI